MDQLIVHCPHCQQLLHGTSSIAGQRVCCASCRNSFVVPDRREDLLE